MKNMTSQAITPLLPSVSSESIPLVRAMRKVNVVCWKTFCSTLRITRWALRQLHPVPTPISDRRRDFEAKSTGLSIPAFEMMLMIVSVLIVIDHVW
jgi:hypothetical protein